MKTKPPTKQQLNVFIFGLNLILLLFSWKAYRSNNAKISLSLIGIGIMLLLVYFINKKLLVKFYMAWMKCVSIIGLIITSIIMFFIFYFIFTPMGLFLKLIRKDVLNLNKQPKLKTYWINKPHSEFDKSNYEKQF